ncbi:hypothetical protein BV22DRAFT_1135399 [Leucogyrophana mollusca]|uniref:Uncharacterized protein n=1 Tax=Leucogyrophana mollusca TaxID=85980 RepID=A0ACB8AX56_9AGAM|nr:hypothetical protein BV22DRAFT_1135399 [Leucogyrophana mollusca]
MAHSFKVLLIAATTSSSSSRPDAGFTLPPLQGRNIDEHFHRIGARSAQPWLSLVQAFASIDLPPKPGCWDIQSGWTKYHFLPDGSSYSEHVDDSQHDGKPEEMLAFDVETMPPYHPFAYIACAASKHAWDPNSARVIVGHNVSYDRARILDEYSLLGTHTRFLDVMALHVAVKVTSSHQRPVWTRHRKSKEKQQERRAEAVQAAVELMRDTEKQYNQEPDLSRKEELGCLRSDIAESLPQLQADEDDADISSKRWEDLTSANSLADVAKLQCDIDMDKTVRNDFMKSTPSEIASAIPDYLSYCAHDVFITHAVFSQVLPAFLVRCPSPVSFAGILAWARAF